MQPQAAVPHAKSLKEWRESKASTMAVAEPSLSSLLQSWRSSRAAEEARAADEEPEEGEIAEGEAPPRASMAVPSATPAAETAEASWRRRLEKVPEALRDALRGVGMATAEPALAFFAEETGSGSHQIVLETDAASGTEIVLKLDFATLLWKRVRRKARNKAYHEL